MSHSSVPLLLPVESEYRSHKAESKSSSVRPTDSVMYDVFSPNLYRDERGLLEAILGLYGLGSPAMLTSVNRN